MAEFSEAKKLDLYNKISELEGVGPVLAKRWKDSGFSREYLDQLENYVQFTEQYDTVDDFIGDKNKLLSKLYDNQKGNMPTDKRIYSFTQKHPDISKDEVIEYFNKTNEYKKQYEQEREEEAGRIRRSREINEEWSLPAKLLTSDYEQERYIRDPKSASFGKESAGILGSSLGSKLDLATGALAAGADFVPGPIAAGVGPAIRLSRDVAHVASDSPYQKSGSQIAKDLVADLGTNYAAFGLANARKVSRIAQNMASPEVKQAIKFNETTNDINRSIKQLGRVPGGRPEDIVDTRRIIENMPETPMKAELMDATKNWSVGDVDWDRVLDIQKRYAIEADLAKKGLLKDVSENNLTMSYIGRDMGKTVKPMDDYARSALLNPSLTRSQKLGVGALNVIDKINTGAPGQIAVQQIASLSGKRTGDLEDKYKSYDFKTAKKWYKENYKRDFDLHFVPREGDDPALIAAYEEYKKEKEKEKYK